jgi:glycine hydroxymethyltransferase
MTFQLKALEKQDLAIYNAIQSELRREETQVELIASENIASKAVLEAQGSVLTNKYAEGYAGRRYYNGCEYVDVVETLAIERLKQLFDCSFANVQPHSGCQANQSVMFALLKPEDTIMGMSLSSGGHLTHGSRVTLSGKWFVSTPYEVDPETYLIDYDDVMKRAEIHKPKLIIAGCSSYSRFIDFKRFREIADHVGAYLMVDMAHFAGLVAGGVYPSPLPYAHVVTSTTHKTLRGPRGGIVLTNEEELAKKIDSSVFPGIQGGPLMHVIAAKAVCFKEALEPSFKKYASDVVNNAKTMGNVLMERGYDVLTKGTDSHLIAVNTYIKNVTGNKASASLEKANITCNKNAIPFDTLSPAVGSGIRLGSPFCTTRGFNVKDFSDIAHWISDVLDAISSNNEEKIISDTKEKIIALCKKHPIYS